MLCKYLHTNSESLAQIRIIFAEIHIILRGLFFIGAPCIVSTIFTCPLFEKCHKANITTKCKLRKY